jgi:hypothetical protein
VSFLDNLENNLKSLESRDEKGPDESERRQREAERARALAAGPWAEKLKNSRFTQDLLEHATRLGHQIRAKVYITWLGQTLRLEARDCKLELRPTPDGIIAAFLVNNEEVRVHPVNLDGKAEDLAKEWLQE